MRIKQRAKWAKPVTVGSKLLARLTTITDEISTANARKIADKNGVSFDELIGDEDKGLDPVEDYDRISRLSSARIEYKYGARTDLTCVFDDGRSFELSSLHGASDTLNDQFGVLKELTVSSATGLSASSSIYLHFDKDFEFRSGSYTIEGEESDVHHISEKLRQALEEAKPDFPILHGLAPVIVMNGAAFILGMVVFFLIVPLVLGSTESMNAVFAFFMPTALCLIALGLVSPFITYFKKAFPKVGYDFGYSRRSTLNRKKAISFAVTVIAAPILLAWLNLT